MPLPSEKELLVMTQKGFAQNVSKGEEKVVATALMTSKPAAGKVVSETKETSFEATTYTLSNGVKVTIKPTDFKTDEILMSGIKKGDTNTYLLPDRSNVLFATDIVSAMGVGEFTPSDLEKVWLKNEGRAWFMEGVDRTCTLFGGQLIDADATKTLVLEIADGKRVFDFMPWRVLCLGKWYDMVK